MEKDILITIAIASYNNAPYIERCIRSVISQSYDNIEILIVDDGSKDDTFERLKSFSGDSRIKVIQKENGGLSSSRQRALDETTGEYICFIDADDYLKTDYIKAMIYRMRNENSDICICSTQVENENGVLNEKDTLAFKVDDNTALKITTDMLAKKNSNLSCKLSLSDSWNKMYKTNFLKSIGVQFRLPKGFNGTDLVFNHKVVLYEPQYSFVSTVGYCHVLYEKSAVRRKQKELQVGFQYIMSDIIEEAKKAGKDFEMKKKIVNLHYYLLRYALQDSFDECENMKQQITAIRNSYHLEKKFIDKYSFLSSGKGCIETMSLRTFYLLYKYCPFALPLFFTARNRFIK